ncbi:uncharacterized protein LOC118746511 [Rhagoletis pomonella]|uniref:uncharacterized protein LOC118746511 n=1 Tax=Rhagoletis pomonella TaxID=28610 RepID=UPI00178532BF|nr:uncharacterized protein LOC118746511 [Rhagoletis pomonella]
MPTSTPASDMNFAIKFSCTHASEGTIYDSSTAVTTSESSITDSTKDEGTKYDSSTAVTTSISPVTDSTTEYEMNQRRYYDEANRRLEANIQSLLNQTGLSEVKRTDLSDVVISFAI